MKGSVSEVSVDALEEHFKVLTYSSPKINIQVDLIILTNNTGQRYWNHRPLPVSLQPPQKEPNPAVHPNQHRRRSIPQRRYRAPVQQRRVRHDESCAQLGNA